MHPMPGLIEDLRFGWRMFLRRPGSSAVAVLTLALGIGANSAIFSVLNAVLLRPLPFRDPDRVVVGWESYEAIKTDFFSKRIPVRLKTWLAWKERSRSFEALTAGQFTNVDITGIGRPERVEAARIPSDFFDVLGVRIAYGRNLSREGERGRSVLISHAFWVSHMGHAPSALGRTVHVNGADYHVVGILPQEFHLPAFMEGFDQQRPALWIGIDLESQRSRAAMMANSWIVFGRLKPGITVQHANAELRALMAGLRRQDPDAYAGWTGNVYAVHAEDVGPQMRLTLLLLQAAVLLVLLIACGNVGHLLLARVLAREREIAIRLAIGAGWHRIARQIFIETLLVSAIGSAAGIGLAPVILKRLVALDPGGINRPETWKVDAGVLVFTCMLTVLSALVAACAPALVAIRRRPVDALRMRGGEGSRAARRVLIGAEVALACTLLIGAALLVRSLQAAMHIDPGFRTDRVLITNIDLPQYKYAASAQQKAFCDRLLEQAMSMPGIESAALAGGVPLQSLSMGSFRVEGQPEPPPGKEPIAHFRLVGPGYFRTLGILLLKGRDFTRQDTAERASPVAIVNETFAKKVWPGQDPIGKALLDGQIRVPVVGVVADTIQLSLEEPPRPEIFYLRTTYKDMVLVVRTAADPATFRKAIAHEVWAIDPELPVRDIRSMTFLVSHSTAQRRFNMILLGAFAGLALLLASVGIYGVVAYSVERRTQEIGLRMALGAEHRDVIGMMLRESLGLVVTGLLIGAVVAAGAVQMFRSLLFGIAPWDAAAFVSGPLILLMVAIAATLFPALRATRIQPNAALRYE